MQLSQFECWNRSRASRVQALKMDARVVYVGFGRRLLAGLIDIALVALVVVTLILLGLAAEESPPLKSELLIGLAGLRSSAMWWLLAIFVAQALFWSYLAATPGMLLLGIQVLRGDTGRRLSLVRSLARGTGLWLGVACLGIGILWSIWDRRNRALHDILVGSAVIKEDESLMTLEELMRHV